MSAQLGFLLPGRPGTRGKSGMRRKSRKTPESAPETVAVDDK